MRSRFISLRRPHAALLPETDASLKSAQGCLNRSAFFAAMDPYLRPRDKVREQEAVKMM